MRLLIVDDIAEFRAAARELLEVRGHVVVGDAADGDAALAVAAETRPDAALVDIRLGEESGFEVARALTDAQPGLAVILISVSDHVPPDVVRACGAYAFVEKYRLPKVDLAALLARR
jgi:DNA-binding NarL/FixJ family response regulator